MGPIACFGVAVFLYVSYRIVTRKSYPRPPGPKGLPVLGNLLDMPTEKHWLKFTEWAQAFGDVVYLDIPGTPIVILNSLKATSELMEKRSANYSDRPCKPACNFPSC